jgi:hypothetical protein
MEWGLNGDRFNSSVLLGSGQVRYHLILTGHTDCCHGKIAAWATCIDLNIILKHPSIQGCAQMVAIEMCNYMVNQYISGQYAL